jgi:hypothetical protein
VHTVLWRYVFYFFFFVCFKYVSLSPIFFQLVALLPLRFSICFIVSLCVSPSSFSAFAPFYFYFLC